MNDTTAQDDAKISYFSSDKITCPVCGHALRREEMRGGRGRIVVDQLTEELRHTYKPSEKYGVVNPLLYSITVCPECCYAAFKSDFGRVSKKAIFDIKRTQSGRIDSMKSVFPQVDFNTHRNIPEGIVSYYYAMHCYEYWSVDSGSIIKQGIAALRIAWLCTDLHDMKPEDNWDAMARVFYRKARYFYRLAWKWEQEENQQVIPSDFNIGPDTDKNYGIDGVRYLVGYLEYRWGPDSNAALRKENILQARIWISKIFDTQQDRKLVPSAIITNARNLHVALNDELQDL